MYRNDNKQDQAVSVANARLQLDLTILTTLEGQYTYCTSRVVRNAYNRRVSDYGKRKPIQ